MRKKLSKLDIRIRMLRVSKLQKAILRTITYINKAYRKSKYGGYVRYPALLIDHFKNPGDYGLKEKPYSKSETIHFRTSVYRSIHRLEEAGIIELLPKNRKEHKWISRIVFRR